MRQCNHSCLSQQVSAPRHAGRPLVMVSGQGATATVWTPDLLQTLAQGRQVTVFTNRGIGYSTDADETEASSVQGMDMQGNESVKRCIISTPVQSCRCYRSLQLSQATSHGLSCLHRSTHIVRAGVCDANELCTGSSARLCVQVCICRLLHEQSRVCAQAVMLSCHHVIACSMLHINI